MTPWDIYQNMIDLGYVKSGKVGKTETTVPAETKQEKSTDKTDNLFKSGGKPRKYQVATILLVMSTALSIIMSLFLYTNH